MTRHGIAHDAEPQESDLPAHAVFPSAVLPAAPALISRRPFYTLGSDPESAAVLTGWNASDTRREG